MLTRAVGRWPMAQVAGTVCGDKASEQEFRLTIRETPRPTKVKALCYANISSVASEPTHSILATLGLWKEA